MDLVSGPMIARLVAITVALSLATGGGVGAQTRDRSTIVIVTGDQATLPIPTLLEGAGGGQANIEMADQLFLKLATLGPELITSGDKGFLPALAKRWTRIDSLTLAFDLDERAVWQDGVPVTAKDVVFTFDRARDPAVAPQLAGNLRRVASVTAEGERRVVFRYAGAYAEQLYDAVWHVAPIPSHLVGTIPASELSKSPYARNPVGDGPYRWVRSVPGQFVELAANERFFLGKPAISRVVIRSASSAEARINMVLSNDADAMDNVLPPLANIDRMKSNPDLRLIPVPSPTLGFLLFNQRDPSDTSRPHGILHDADVRRAIVLSLDRALLLKAAYGSYGEVPYGPASAILWIGRGAGRPSGADRPRARRLLAARGWREGGDGILEKNGVPLRLTLNYPNTSAVRERIALLAQQQLRQMGIDIVLRVFDYPVYREHWRAGQFDIDFSSTLQDPSPSGLTQGWTCGGATNVGHYCNPRVDSLIDRAIADRQHAADAWHSVLRQIEDDAPAAFMYAPSYVFAVQRRFGNVNIRPESSWRLLYKWTAEAPAPRHDTDR
jgi:peptide/nickel transport system substrate-binding protein